MTQSEHYFDVLLPFWDEGLQGFWTHRELPHSRLLNSESDVTVQRQDQVSSLHHTSAKTTS
eukprot:2544242-Amphidinium_carterae.1